PPAGRPGAAVLLRPVRRGDGRGHGLQHRHREEPDGPGPGHAAWSRRRHDQEGGPTVDLTTSLRAAAGEPPPTSIDLDRLIRAEQRRAYRQRRLFGAGLVSGVAVLVGAAS